MVPNGRDREPSSKEKSPKGSPPGDHELDE
jgi:hypothetical protein